MLNKKALVLIILYHLFILCIYFSNLNATVRYVSKTGSSIPPYTTWETAADSIQKCINICVFGDTIYVANGIYEERIVMIPGLSLIGSGADSCVVDCRNFPPQGLHAVEVADSCFIKGFYIRTSNDFNYGEGIYTIGQNGLITENKFSNANTGITLWGSSITAYGNYFFNIRVGIDVFNSNSIVRKNVISPYTGIEARGIFITAFNDNYTPIIDSNYIIANSGNGIRKSIGATPTITNNIIVFTQFGADAIFLGGSDSSKVLNNRIIIGTGYGGINNNSILQIKMCNNYLIGNAGASGIKAGGNDIILNNVVTDANNGIIPYSTQNITVQHNNSWNNNVNYSGFTPDTTNLSVDPMIVNDDTTQGDLDFHLQKFSPLIDAGDPNILDKDSSRSDIGLYGGPYGESYIYIDLPPRPPVNLTANVDSLIKLNWKSNTEADFSYYNVYRDTSFNFTPDSTKLIASITDTFYYHTFPTNVETLYYKLTAIDNQGNESNPSEQVAVILVTVKNEWKPVNNYILYQNYPNPFNPSTKIGYKLKERGYVKLYVYDIKGELVSVLVNEVQETGYYEVEFNAEVKGQMSNVKGQLASGVYIYQIFVSNDRSIPVFSDIKKMLLVK